MSERTTQGEERSSLAHRLSDAVRTGDYAALGELLGDNAVLDTSSEQGRYRVRGPEAILQHLSAPGPGEVLDWDAREWDTGVAITFEWRGAGGPDRRRWYVRRTDSEIVGIWSYAARPRSDPPSRRRGVTSRR